MLYPERMPRIKIAKPHRDTLQSIIAKAGAFKGDLAEAAKVDPDRLAAFLNRTDGLTVEELEKITSTLFDGMTYDDGEIIVGKACTREKIAMTLPESFTGHDTPQVRSL